MIDLHIRITELPDGKLSILQKVEEHKATELEDLNIEAFLSSFEHTMEIWDLFNPILSEETGEAAEKSWAKSNLTNKKK